MNYKKYVDGLFILLIPAFLCLIIFYLDPEIKKALTLNTEDYSILTLYTTNFVHYEPGHLLRNLFYYALFGFVSMLLYNHLDHDKIFRYSLLAILIVVPIFSSAYSMYILSSFGGSGNIYGFSGITGAAIGMFGYAVALLISFDKKDNILSYLFLIFATLYFFVSMYVNTIAVILILLFITALPLTMVAWRHAREKEKIKRIVVAYVLAMFYLFFLTLMFPISIVSGDNVVNIWGHLSGVILQDNDTFSIAQLKNQ
ncbi:hypothetical protein GAH_01016 [Geoglobus ahangari]|uniref:Rhomboid family intramembrane serine protease n=1 Tax=Geoglobus ahangari TaxID=113653 RepID=A0A0F7IFK0_9EURY|nr:hypothetical protein [Geoglobus ahangari]AKG91660.1 hypothetical protein GAH_01016 [Geoglobus ahangari]